MEEKNGTALKSRLIWIGAIASCLFAEGIVIHLQVSKQTQSLRSFKFYFLPIMLTLPLSTAAGMLGKWKKDPIKANDQVSFERISCDLASMAIWTYWGIFMVLVSLDF